MSTDYPDWSVPQTNANAIAATGVPLLTAKTSLSSNTLTIGPGALQQVLLIPVTQPSYEIQLAPYESGAGAAGGLLIEMQWVDSATLGQVAQETYYVWPGVASGDHIIYGRGPSKADRLTVTMVNQSAAMTYKVFYNLLGSSRLFARDDLRTVTYLTTASGNTIPTLDPPSTLLGYRSLSVAAAGNDVTELPLYTGLAQLFADTGSSTTDFTLTIQDSSNPFAEGTGIRMMRFKSDSHGFIFAQIALPRYQCRVNMNNANAAAQSLTYSLHTIES